MSNKPIQSLNPSPVLNLRVANLENQPASLEVLQPDKDQTIENQQTAMRPPNLDPKEWESLSSKPSEKGFYEYRYKKTGDTFFFNVKKKKTSDGKPLLVTTYQIIRKKFDPNTLFVMFTLEQKLDEKGGVIEGTDKLRAKQELPYNDASAGLNIGTMDNDIMSKDAVDKTKELLTLINKNPNVKKMFDALKQSGTQIVIDDLATYPSSDSSLACFDFLTNTIHLRAEELMTSDKQTLASTLIHEMGHALIHKHNEVDADQGIGTDMQQTLANMLEKKELPRNSLEEELAVKYFANETTEALFNKPHKAFQTEQDYDEWIKLYPKLGANNNAIAVFESYGIKMGPIGKTGRSIIPSKARQIYDYMHRKAIGGLEA